MIVIFYYQKLALDGINTLHIMCIIQNDTTGSVILEEHIPRIKEVLSARDFTAKAHVPIQVYQHNGVIGYSKVKVEDFGYEIETTLSLLKKSTWYGYMAN